MKLTTQTSCLAVDQMTNLSYIMKFILINAQLLVISNAIYFFEKYFNIDPAVLSFDEAVLKPVKMTMLMLES